MVASVAQQSQPDSVVNQANRLGPSGRITEAIETAAAQTGVDFAYLLTKASQESSLDPNAKASSSSATGLFQFTSQTWLQMVKNYGGKYGLGTYADHITIDTNGVAHADSPQWKHAILALRRDPQISAEMAGELDKRNYASLKATVGGKIGPTELYLAHFLGAGGATDFLKTLRSDPNTSAADVLPDAAAANPSVFYNKDGEPRSLAQIYRHFAQKFDQTPSAPGASSILIANAADTAASPPSFNVANTNGISLPLSSYAPSAMSGLNPDSSSLMNALVLAQINMNQMASNAAFGTMANLDHKKNSALSVLGGVA